jgi:hypothetical protein
MHRRGKGKFWIHAQQKSRPHAESGFCVRAVERYSPIVSSDALPPAAVVLIVSVRSPAKRSR